MPRHPRPSAARRALRRRAADRRAGIGIMALGLMILLAATSLAIFVTITATAHATRESRALVTAMRNLDHAQADAAYALNSAPTATGANGTGAGHIDSDPRRWSTWSWTKTTNPAHGVRGGGRVTMRSLVGTVDQERVRAWRYRLLGSRSTTPTGELVYGVAAPSAWTSLVSTVDTSWIQGTVDGDWHQYGDGDLTVRPGSQVDRVISYDDASTQAGVPTEFFRSTLSATLDEHLLNERVTNCGADLRHFRSSTNPGGPRLTAGSVACYYSVTIDVPTVIEGIGAATVISYGDVDIRSSITTTGGNQLHLYTTSGTVKFRGAGTINAFIYAPNALCKTWDAQTVNYTGSLVCRQAMMHGNFHPPTALPILEAAGTANDGIPDHSVSYLERPGYRDRFGN